MSRGKARTRSWAGLHRATTVGEATQTRYGENQGPNPHADGEERFFTGHNGNLGAQSDEEDGEELPPASPGTPPKKVWEQKYRHFLHRRQPRPSPGSSTDSSTYSPKPANPLVLDGRTFIPPRAIQGLPYATPQFRSGTKVAPPPPPPPPSKAPLQSNNEEGEDSSVRGGKLFSTIFRKNSHQESGGAVSRGSSKSLNSDELDVPLRRGVEKACSPRNKREIPSWQSIEANSSSLLPPARLSDTASCPSLNARVLANPSSHLYSPSLNGRLSHSSLHSRESSGWGQHVYQDAFKHEYNPDGGAPAGSLFLPPAALSAPNIPMPRSIHMRATSIASVEESDEPYSETGLVDELEITSRKKVFTELHNSHNSDSPFLGEDCSITTAALFVQTPRSKFSAAAASHLSHTDFNLATNQSSLLLTPVPENIEITQQRVLRSFVGVDQWKTGRRYLVAPAVLAACPSDTSAPFLLEAKQQLLASQAAHAVPPVLDGCILLGNCLMSYSLQGNASITAKTWSRASLMLRQNYLLEFGHDHYEGDPRGYAHLCGAKAHPHPDFQDAVELIFYGSPCSRADVRSLLIRLADRSERDACIICLNRAAELEAKDLYEMDENCELLGDGNYSQVRRARVRSTNEFVALKIFDKTLFWKLVVKGRERADTLVRETSVQATLTSRCRDVPSFLQLRGFFETSDQVMLELELLEGTDLFRYISSKKRALLEYEAAWILADILRCLISMNGIGAAHRDIKPANVLMCGGTDVSVAGGSTAPRVKVCDFGMSTFVGVDGQVRGRCGTPGYVAPEIFTTGLHGGYGNKVDVYSVGVTLYVMLCGFEPFYGETDKELAEANQMSKVEFPKEEWRNVSKDARNLVELLMEKDPEKRPSAKEALLHPWFKSHLGRSFGELPAETRKQYELSSSVAGFDQNDNCAIV